MIQNISNFYTTAPKIFVTGRRIFGSDQSAEPETDFTSDAVKLTLSPEAQRLLGKNKADRNPSNTDDEYNATEIKPTDEQTGKSTVNSGSTELSPEEERLVQRLKQTDTAVRIHERQHVAAAGGYVKGGPIYNYITGPDGKRYAVGGRVSLDITSVPNNPEATIRKAQIIKRAALAPADPSAADRAVAANAEKMEQKARAQLQAEARKESKAETAKGQHFKFKAYTRSFLPTGQAVNILI
ncbi:MAG: hypothetical protein GX075_13570 [Firmicutes bacterium]|nr:hypothetical protein [Bacillota bacterium]